MTETATSTTEQIRRGETWKLDDGEKDCCSHSIKFCSSLQFSSLSFSSCHVTDRKGSFSNVHFLSFFLPFPTFYYKFHSLRESLSLLPWQGSGSSEREKREICLSLTEYIYVCKNICTLGGRKKKKMESISFRWFMRHFFVALSRFNLFLYASSHLKWSWKGFPLKDMEKWDVEIEKDFDSLFLNISSPYFDFHSQEVSSISLNPLWSRM